ncbi:MAG: lipid II flippase MurJ, partial [Candidatus Gastranaerophilales bacterium]|nr:lipid II flippase MurJ [Candidatus Gastranaerophilales bacterium]
MSKLFKTAGLIALITILSKFFGFARDIFIANQYGATLVSDAYFYAYQIPALALILLGGLNGPFHTATVAVFSKLLPENTTNPEEKIQKILNHFITTAGCFFFLLSILIFFFSENIIKLIASGATEELISLAAIQLKIMSPIILIGGIIGIFYGIANVCKEFVITSFSPTITSLFIIAGLFLFSG